MKKIITGVALMVSLIATAVMGSAHPYGYYDRYGNFHTYHHHAVVHVGVYGNGYYVGYSWHHHRHWHAGYWRAGVWVPGYWVPG